MIDKPLLSLHRPEYSVLVDLRTYVNFVGIAICKQAHYTKVAVCSS